MGVRGLAGTAFHEQPADTTMHANLAQSLRDVIAFPKTTAARALFEGAPTPVNSKDLSDLHLELRPATSN